MEIYFLFGIDVGYTKPHSAQPHLPNMEVLLIALSCVFSMIRMSCAKHGAHGNINRI